jgi:hypothetical protein
MFGAETAFAALSYGASVKRVGFRGRLFLILLAFALIPSILISLAWSVTGSFVLPLVPATAAWDSVAATGKRAISAARAGPLTPAQHHAFDIQRAARASYHRCSRFVFRRAAQPWRLCSGASSSA